jgi:c-di-GMP-binding flagellar brake protein YcgR
MSELQAAPGPIASQYLSDRGEIERVFRIFRDHALPVKLRFGRAEEEFTARILEVTGSQFLLEDMRPRTGMHLLRNREPFSLAGRVDGIYAHVDELRVAEVSEDRGVPYYVVPLPKEMLYQQRRRTQRFRLPLDATDGARITLYRAERELSGHLADISAGGCRAIFDVVVDPKIAADEVVDRCDIDIPNLLILTSRTIIRHQSLNKQTGQLACGIEFAEMRLADRRRLERFITKIAKISDPA